MKIVDVCAFYTPHGGGVRTYVEQKLRIAPQMGHEIVILAPGDHDEVIERGPQARIVRIRSPRLPVDRKYWYFADDNRIHDMLDAEMPDFVEATSPWRSARIVAEWRGSAPRSLVMHADPLSAYAYRWFGEIFSRPTIDRRMSLYWEHLRRQSRLFDFVVGANGDLTRRLREGGVSGTVTVPMGVEAGLFSPQRRDPRLRARMLEACGLPDSAGLLIAVGRLAPEKRWPLVIDAVNAASRDMPLGLVMLGEGRERRAILKHIAGNPHIRLFEPERDRATFATLLASADALVHACEAETFCMVAAEARASGLPVIVPDSGGAADHAAGGAGLAFASGDAASAASAIRTVIAQGLRPAATARGMDQHFADLFALYAKAAAHRRQAA
ncbi:glycosyltransferase [Novosphingobium colocasiae]|uniref:glycosyltransferase n=1 Tax=Novosphingobium colocasiae TaxID=1256513 RepID=UPI0035B1C817